MNFENLSFQDNPGKRQEKSDKETKREIDFPHAESILGQFKNKYKNETEKSEIMEDILYEFFDQEMENINVFESERLGAAFPWTVIKTEDLTRKIVAKYSDLSIDKHQIKKQEFIFSSGSLVKSGYPFTFVEEAMHQAIATLKSDLLALKDGREITAREIYTLGLPTNELGKISPDFLEKLKEDPFSSMAELLSDFIKSRIPGEANTQDVDIKLYGISTGASFAAATGEKLIKDGVATQSPEEILKHIPSLAIRMDSPVGLSKSKTKKWQIPLGYVTEGIYQFFSDPKFRLTDVKFMSQVKVALDKRGIKENMSDQDEKIKNETIKVIINKLIEGVEFSPDLKVTKVTGILDPLTFSLENYSTEKNRQVEMPDGLGKNIAPRGEVNRREFMINMSHKVEFFRPSELKRYYKTAGLVQELKDKTH